MSFFLYKLTYLVEIMTLLHNIPQGPDAPPLQPEVEQALGKLLRQRQEELRAVVIRL
jgi:hypothetical protein